MITKTTKPDKYNESNHSCRNTLVSKLNNAEKGCIHKSRIGPPYLRKPTSNPVRGVFKGL